MGQRSVASSCCRPPIATVGEVRSCSRRARNPTRPAAAFAGRHSARRAVCVRQRALLPRQADLRAAISPRRPTSTIRSSAAACTSSRTNAGLRSPDTRVTASGDPAISRPRTSIRTIAPTGVRSSRARSALATRNRRLRGRAARQHRVAEVRGRAARDLRRAGCCFRRIRRPRRHEPRRPAAAARGRRRRARHTCRSPAPCATAAAAEARPSMPTQVAADDSRATRTTSCFAVGKREVRLTNLRKIFWPELGLTKGDLLQYYADVADVLLPHMRDRAMVMKRYPHGAAGEFFFMKRAPSPRPDWIRDLHDRSRQRQRHRFSGDRRSARRSCGSSISGASI